MPNGNIFPTNYLQMLKAIVVVYTIQGRIQDFKLGGAHLEKLRRVEGGAKIFGVFRVKNHDFTPKNHIFPNCGGRRENFGGISCEKSRFYAIFSPPTLGGRAGCAPPGSAPAIKTGMSNTWQHYCLEAVFESFQSGNSYDSSW
jgi:hypothetical protein